MLNRNSLLLARLPRRLSFLLLLLLSHTLSCRLVDTKPQTPGPVQLKSAGDSSTVFTDTFTSFFRLTQRLELSGAPNLAKGITSLLIGPRGEFFLCYKSHPAVYRFDSTGMFLGRIGNVGKAQGQYVSPTALRLDKAGNIYVLDSRQAKILLYTVVGLFSKEVPLRRNAADFALLDENEDIILFHPQREKAISVYSKKGELNKSFSENERGLPISGGKIQIDNDGNILELQPNRSQIRVFSKDGTLLKIYEHKSLFFRALDRLPEDYSDVQMLDQIWTPMVGLFLLGSGEFILTQMRITISEVEKSYFLTIFDKEGGVVASDVRLPGYIVGCNGKDAIYLVEAQPNKNAQSERLILAKYVLM